jgi:hypothetical protein
MACVPSVYQILILVWWINHIKINYSTCKWPDQCWNTGRAWRMRCWPWFAGCAVFAWALCLRLPSAEAACRSPEREAGLPV